MEETLIVMNRITQRELCRFLNGAPPKWVMEFARDLVMLDWSQTPAFTQFKMTDFSDFTEQIPAVNALGFYDLIKKNVIQSGFADFSAHRCREISMVAARRQCKLVADIHWLNRCLSVNVVPS